MAGAGALGSLLGVDFSGAAAAEDFKPLMVGKQLRLVRFEPRPSCY